MSGQRAVVVRPAVPSSIGYGPYFTLPDCQGEAYLGTESSHPFWNAYNAPMLQDALGTYTFVPAEEAPVATDVSYRSWILNGQCDDRIGTASGVVLATEMNVPPPPYYLTGQ